MGSVSPAPHVIVFPLPAQGHVNGAMDLARKLASLDVSITFACTEACIEGMKKQGFDAGGLPIRLHGLPDGVSSQEKETFADIAESIDQNDLLFQVIDSMVPAFREMLETLRDEGNGAACVVYDFTVWWVGGLCKELGIPAYIFQPFSSSFFLFAVHMPDLASQGRLPLGSETNRNDKSNVFKIRGLPDLHASDLPDFCWDPNPVCPFDYALRCTSQWRDASGVLFNSVYELEKEMIDRFMEMAPEMDIKTVGPLLPLGFLQEERGTSAAGSSELSAAAQSCLEWLDEQPAASVLYAAFGTIACLSEEQTKELAEGLEACGQRFLWVLRIPESHQQQGKDNKELLPIGFEERMRMEGRGMVLWEVAPQRDILRNPAVGAFLTHNGWNSTMESLCKGLPMLCMPVFADQPITGKWVEEMVGAGKLLKKMGDSGIVRKEEVGCMAREILGPATPLRASAARARDVACHAALNPSGSSLHNLRAFVQMLTTQST